MNSIRKNIVLNGFANVGQRIVTIANQLLLVPFFLTAWGTEYYGEWLTLCTIPSVLMFSDMGFGTSASNAFVLAYSDKNYQKAANIYCTGFIIITCCIILGIIISFSTMLIVAKTELLDKSLISAEDAVWALTFMMSGRLVGFYNQLFEAFFRSMHRAASATNYKSIEGSFLILSGIFVLWKDYGVVMYAFTSFIASSIFNLVYALIAINVIDNLPIGRFDKKEVKMICSKGFGYLASPLRQALYFQGSTLVVRAVLGAEAVAFFNTIRKVVRTVNHMFNIIGESTFPELQIAIGQNNMVLAKSIFFKSMKLVLATGVIGVIFLSTTGIPIYNWWTHNSFSVTFDIWVLFMIGILITSTWSTAGFSFRAFNKPYYLALVGIVSSLISLCAIYILSNACGVLGTTIGYVSYDLMMALFVLPYAFRKYWL